MAGVRICPQCGHPNAAHSLVCEYRECGVSIAHEPLQDATEAGSSLSAAALEFVGAVGARATGDSSSGRANASAEDSAGAPRLVVAFPWGPVCVERTLAVGRDPAFSPVAGQLRRSRNEANRHGDFKNVSRRHALIVVRNGLAFVRDVGSANGTYLNGVRLQANVETAVQNNDELRFGRDLTARVRIARLG